MLTTAQLDVTAIYQKGFMTSLTQKVVLPRFAQKATLRPRQGNKFVWFIWGALNETTTPLTEGQNPTPKNVSITEVVANVQPYGDYVEYSHEVDLQNPDPILANLTVTLADQAGRSVEKLIINELANSTNIVYSNGSARNEVNTILDADDLEKALDILEDNGAQPLVPYYYDEGRVSNQFVQPAYILLIPPKLRKTVSNFSGFVPIRQYGTPDIILPGEIGMYKNVRVVTHKFCHKYEGAGASGVDPSVIDAYTPDGGTTWIANVYASYLIAFNAYGIAGISLDNVANITELPDLARPQLYITRPGEATKSDPLGQKGTFGWKVFFDVQILESGALVKLESAAPA